MFSTLYLKDRKQFVKVNRIKSALAIAESSAEVITSLESEAANAVEWLGGNEMIGNLEKFHSVLLSRSLHN